VRQVAAKVEAKEWDALDALVVEDEKGQLTGLITSGLLLNHYTNCVGEECKSLPVEKIMIKNPITVPPETLTTEAIAIMQKKKIGCLPVVRKSKLVGIVTEHDFMTISARLLEELHEIEYERIRERKKGDMRRKVRNGKVFIPYFLFHALRLTQAGY